MKRTLLLLKIFGQVTTLLSAGIAWSYLCTLLAGSGVGAMAIAVGIPMVAALCGAIYLDLRKKPS